VYYWLQCTSNNKAPPGLSRFGDDSATLKPLPPTPAKKHDKRPLQRIRNSDTLSDEQWVSNGQLEWPHGAELGVRGVRSAGFPRNGGRPYRGLDRKSRRNTCMLTQYLQHASTSCAGAILDRRIFSYLPTNSTNMRKSTLLLAIALSASAAQAQIPNKIYAEPADFKIMAEKILVVELPEENPKVIEEFSRKTATADAAAYKAGLESYREAIEPAIRAHWKFNEQIEFKTTSEIVKLFASKSKDHVALLKVVLADGGGVYAYTFGLGVPALALTRTDGDSEVNKKGQLSLRKHDYQMYLAFRDGEKVDDESFQEVFNATSMAFTLKQAQRHINWIMNSTEKKSEEYIDYCKAESKRNCSRMKSKQLVVEEGRLHKSFTKAEANEKFGRDITYMTIAEMDALYDGGDAEHAILYSLPIGTFKANLVMTYYAFLKVVVDPSTDDVIEAIIPAYGKPLMRHLLPGDMRGLSDCD